jgi:hypothetical protein
MVKVNVNNVNEKEMIKIAEREIREFVDEWKKKPYLWESESDIHGDIYMRIKNSLHKKFPPNKKYKYKEKDRKECLDWIYCKPPIVKAEKRKRRWCYPDIVIFKYNEENNDCIKDRPIWICEIKYITNWSGTLSNGVRNDIKKLERWLDQEYDVHYLILLRKRRLSKSNETILERRDKRIKLCT